MKRFIFFLGLAILPIITNGQDAGSTYQTVAQHYANLVRANYEDSATEARSLRKAIYHFTQKPSEKSLQQAKSAWIKSRKPYLQTEAFRFYAGPIDDADGPEIFINAWPVDEAYIDYVEGSPQSGIINDPGAFPKLTQQLIQEANERGGETMISCGYHAIEFLLWGQDFSDDGPGERAFTDYTTAPHAKRRSQYLELCGDLLVKHLDSLVSDWSVPEKGQSNYRKEFLSNPKKAAWNIVAGIKHLSGTELAGERLLVAWDTQSQEDEHSCFSDTTHLDLAGDIQGMKNVYTGNYRRTNGEMLSGPGMKDLVEELMPELNTKIEKLLTQTIKKSAAIPIPFDQAILGDRQNAPSRKKVLACVESLEDHAALWAQFEQRLIKEVRQR